MGNKVCVVVVVEMCFPSPGLGHKYKLKIILKQHYSAYSACRT